jgi:hypothetical protein
MGGRGEGGVNMWETNRTNITPFCRIMRRAPEDLYVLLILLDGRDATAMFVADLQR